MTQNKQPIIQSVFDQRMNEQNENFFLKALHELQGYRRELLNAGVTSAQYTTHIGKDNEKKEAYRALLVNLSSSENILSGVLNSFDVLSEEHYF